MGIFDPYKSVIRKAVENDKLFEKVQLSQSGSAKSINESIKNLRAELPSLEYYNATIKSSNGITGSSSVAGFPNLGDHPDFSYLRGTDESVGHWIITGFIDVKGSTRLFNKFSKETVRLITESIIRAAIFAVNDCKGYVHRIQGDGLMVYFGGKGIDKKLAVEDALKAFSMITHFVKNDLKEFFEENGIRDIHTRSALDLGHDNQVVWHYSGIGSAGEVTTCSLYTSLVPKMQANANQDSIIVGENLYNQMNSSTLFSKRTNEIWTFDDGRIYNQYDFHWSKYLVKIGKARQDANGQIYLNDPVPVSNHPRYLHSMASQNKPYFSE